MNTYNENWGWVLGPDVIHAAYDGRFGGYEISGGQSAIRIQRAANGAHRVMSWDDPETEIDFIPADATEAKRICNAIADYHALA